MRKIINNRVYDTDRATRVASWSYGHDLTAVTETLYRKRSREYFVCGEGGPSTRYAAPDGHSGWTSGARIMPLTALQAREWAREHMEPEAYAVAFAPHDAAVASVVRISGEAKLLLDDEADRTGETLHDVASRAIVEALGDVEKL